MATEDPRDSQIWDALAARWAVTHPFAVGAQHALAHQGDACYLGAHPAPRVDAMDKLAALWAEANRHRDAMHAFVRAHFG